MNPTQWQLSISLIRNELNRPPGVLNRRNPSNHQISNVSLIQELTKGYHRYEFVDALDGATNTGNQPIFVLNALDVSSMSTQKGLLFCAVAVRSSNYLSRNNQMVCCRHVGILLKVLFFSIDFVVVEWIRW
jgi:hypothetical protein